jgi:hypothetical protein
VVRVVTGQRGQRGQSGGSGRTRVPALACEGAFLKRVDSRQGQLARSEQDEWTSGRVDEWTTPFSAAEGQRVGYT